MCAAFVAFTPEPKPKDTLGLPVMVRAMPHGCFLHVVPGLFCSLQFPSFYPDIAGSFLGFQKVGKHLATMLPLHDFRILIEPQSESSCQLPRPDRTLRYCLLAVLANTQAASLSLSGRSVKGWKGTVATETVPASSPDV